MEKDKAYLDPMVFSFPVRVYYEDTDAGGVVYHASYLRFFERARVESLRELGLELNYLISQEDCQFVVREIQVEFLKPAYLDQSLVIYSKMTEVSGPKIRYNQQLRLKSEKDDLLCCAEVLLVCLNSRFQPRRVPKVLMRGVTA